MLTYTELTYTRHSSIDNATRQLTRSQSQSQTHKKLSNIPRQIDRTGNLSVNEQIECRSLDLKVDDSM